jgi:hypothetical protein
LRRRSGIDPGYDIHQNRRAAIARTVASELSNGHIPAMVKYESKIAAVCASALPDYRPAGAT